MSYDWIKVSPDDLGKIVKKVMGEYSEEAREAINEVGTDVARDTVKHLKSIHIGKRQRYCRGWRHKQTVDKTYSGAFTVYNATDYQLTHLLNNDHPTGEQGVNEGQYFGDDHIGKANEFAQDEFTNRLLKKLGY